jgi:hypothetical protein
MTNKERAAQVWVKIEDLGTWQGKTPPLAAVKIIAAYGQEQFHAGVEKMRNAARSRAVWFEEEKGYVPLQSLNEEAAKLLAELEGK